ncbi:hypothetical protein [Qipengyuania vesicularis]|uniref:hypothetical protein n=1 Tax=Qipengyuania vesicularis TaxID=2867232 RepID=UPI001C8826E1|nr:hypothetical protein [Qipengyuania vesicularis]MBX7527787.1 hypothetical protein [Qipengyuania vesicularis]
MDRRIGHRFYLATGIYVFVLGAVGFARNFYLRPFGSEPLADAGPIYAGSILHGLVCTAWMALAVWQPWLVMRGKTALHRKTGRWGAVVAILLIVTGLVVTWSQAVRFAATGETPGFVIVPLGTLAMFALAFGLAIHFRKRPEYHKRWIVVAHCTLLAPPAARALVTFEIPPVPLIILLISFPLLVGLLLDIWKRRAVPWIYLIGIFLVVVVGGVRQQMVNEPAWIVLVERVLT